MVDSDSDFFSILPNHVVKLIVGHCALADGLNLRTTSTRLNSIVNSCSARWSQNDKGGNYLTYISGRKYSLNFLKSLYTKEVVSIKCNVSRDNIHQFKREIQELDYDLVLSQRCLHDAKQTFTFMKKKHKLN